MNERFADVWDALKNTAFEAENRRVRFALMTKLREYIINQRLTQSDPHPRVGRFGRRVSGHGQISAVFGLSGVEICRTVAPGWTEAPVRLRNSSARVCQGIGGLVRRDGAVSARPVGRWSAGSVPAASAGRWCRRGG